MSQLSNINHIVVLMFDNRSFDHMLGFLYGDSGYTSPAGQPFEGTRRLRIEPGWQRRGRVIRYKALQCYLHPGADSGLESLTKDMNCELTPPCDVDVVRA